MAFSSIQEFWDGAIARGLFPLPIARNSKAPIGEGWNQWTTPVPHPGAAAVGLRCGDGGLSAFDFDTYEPEHASRLLHAMRSLFGPSMPVRYGRRPKFLVPFYLVDAPVTGRTFSFSHGSVEGKSDKLQLINGQFVAYGIHPETGQPYEWENFDAPWPRLTTAHVQQVLSEVPARAGTSLRFSADHETCSEAEIAEAIPRDNDEWNEGRRAAERYLGTLTQELRGKTEGRGSIIFALAGVLKFAERAGLCSREEIEGAVYAAGHSLDEKVGGRSLGEEIARHDGLPVLRGNLIMLSIMRRRAMLQGLRDAAVAPTLAPRTGFELNLADADEELPWILYQRILAAEVHFFTGHSGAGKSTVLTDMVYRYLKGEPWLEAEIERTDGHVLWIAAEDDYGTARRFRHLLRQEPNGAQLAARIHIVPVQPGAAFEQQTIAQVQAMEAMGMRVDLIPLDTWGASGLCFADNDTEAVLKAMWTLKRVAAVTKAAVIVTDHLPLGNEDAWQKGNGAKSGNSGFMYRVTAGKQDMVSIDCGKARGAPKAKSYTGRVVSESYGADRKGRQTTVNVFKRTVTETAAQREQSAAMKLAAMLPGATATGMDALRSGSIVKFDSVASELGQGISGEMPAYVISRDAATKMFDKDAYNTLTNSGHFRSIRGAPYLAIYPPTGVQQQPLTMASWSFTAPATGNMPWG